jgi:hypothetical protein
VTQEGKKKDASGERMGGLNRFLSRNIGNKKAVTKGNIFDVLKENNFLPKILYKTNTH